MKTQLSISLVICLFLSVYSISCSQHPKLADKYWHQANELKEHSRLLEAAQMYEKSAEAEKASPRPRLADLVSELYLAGYCYYLIGQYNKALKYYEEALAIARKSGREGDIAIVINNIGTVYDAWGQYDKAIRYYEEALAIARKLGQESDIASDLNNIGGVYFKQKMYPEAISNFSESVELLEKLRKTATGDVRRDYLASQINTYQLLTSAHLRNDDFLDAFHTIELSRAKLLAEQLAGSESKVSVPSVEQIQKEMPNDAAILIYANVGLAIPVVQLVITNSNINGLEISDKDFIASALGQYETSVQNMLKNQRGIKIVKKDKKEELVSLVEKKDDFENIINYYRSLLTNPSKTNNEKAKELGGILYDFLIKPVSGHIGDKTELIIIPDGVLGFIPFETLIDENGQYLVETYHIKYTQSMGVSELIKKRKYVKKRKPLLAFGGAIYDEVTYAVDMLQNENQLAYLEKKIYSAFSSRGSVRDAYVSLGVGSWENLPGTLSEIKAINKVVKDVKILKGNEVTEDKVKTLSANGKLSEYRVLHFATHGLVVPALPELSALVLSQFKVEQGNEDGYLRMGEIAELNIEADFVNLSACETGLGKIYGGEGVVGLTQSFLIAGANGLSVSLWQVADISTSQFMVAMYELVENEGIDYADAITEIKHRFIKGDFGDEYKAPYYWAPFVYYGK